MVVFHCYVSLLEGTRWEESKDLPGSALVNSILVGRRSTVPPCFSDRFEVPSSVVIGSKSRLSKSCSRWHVPPGLDPVMAQSLTKDHVPQKENQPVMMLEAKSIGKKVTLGLVDGLIGLLG